MELFNVYSIQNITIDRAEGCRVYDEKGAPYLDLYGGHAVISIGHRHPHWVKRIENQLNRFAFYSNSVRIPIQQELAHKMGEVSGRPDYRLFLINSGAEANENAFKLASFHTQRKKIVAFKGAFHGRTSLAVAATDNPAIVSPSNETENVAFLPFNDEGALTEYFAVNGAKVASVILEPIQGVGGIQVVTASFLKLIRKLCNDSGAVMISDEVQCGFGRSGKFFSADHAGIDADIYTMAKGMGNGFPVAGILIHPKFEAKMGMLGTTFGGNPLACAATLAVLEVMAKENLMAHAEQMGQYLMTELAKIEWAKNLRGQGLMIGFDLPTDKADKRYDLKSRLLRDFKIFTGEAKPNTIRLLPPLTITRAEIDEFLLALKKAGDA
jgi:acetylornithine/N-succinyldiaminopimelate aminotransferase